MYLSKEITDKDQNHKMKTKLSLDNEDPANNSEKIWNSNGFFGNQRGDFSQGTGSTFKAGDYAIYLDYVILWQLILANNCSDLDNYKLKENEVMIYAPLYNTENGYFRGVKKWLAYKMVRGDLDKTFFSYSHDEERSKISS